MKYVLKCKQQDHKKKTRFDESKCQAIIDVFEKTNGHEPRVAIAIGRVLFHIDLQTGSWVLDSSGTAKCDHNKQRVKK